MAEGPLDVLVVGGGITGAGLLLAAARRGLRALLVEGGDFASGTSSRSGKLVHGGMRYLAHLRVGLTRTLLRERDRLLRDHPGLVDPMEFVLPTYRHRRKDRLSFAVAVRAYDLLRGRGRSWTRYGPEEVLRRYPGLMAAGLDGGFGYVDAVTDDARMVLRTLRDARCSGGHALNYVRAGELVREGGRVAGAELLDGVSGRSVVVRARRVLNATGAQADGLRGQVGALPRLRPVRGTHLVFPRETLPFATAVSVRHPADDRYIYLVPWEGATLVGTTDLDDPRRNGGEPRPTPEEVAYLLEALAAWFPGTPADRHHLVAAFAGVRPIVDSGSGDPYSAGRESVLWDEEGLVTVVSGKLTGFQAIVMKALHKLPSNGGGHWEPEDRSAAPDDGLAELDPGVRTRLLGRYGRDASALVAAAGPGEMEPVGDTGFLWAEVRWGARGEGVRHLDDLLLRRARVGVLLPGGGAAHFPRVREICRQELGWGDARWMAEEARYRSLWSQAYEVP